MKKLAFLAGPLIAVVAFLSLAFPAASVYADAKDSQAISSVSTALDKLATFMEASAETPDEEFYPQFTTHAGDTRQVVNRAYAGMGHTTEAGEAKAAVQQVRSVLSDMKKILASWQESAANRDADAFNSQNDQFNAAVDRYNQAIDDYNRHLAATSTYFVALLITLAASLILLPLLLWFRSKQLKARASKTANASLATPLRKFLLLNILTLDLYVVYWGWKAWEITAKAEGQKYRSVLRAIFLNLTAFSLFGKIKNLAHEAGDKRTYPHIWLALGFLLLYLLALPVWQENSFAILLGTVIIIALLTTLLLAPVLRAQNYFVIHTKKTLLPLRRDLLILGVLGVFWVLSLFALVAALFGL